MREQATEVLYLDAAGHTTREIARKLEIRPIDVKGLRDLAGDGVINVLKADGYSVGEIVRTLGVATARVLPPLAA